MFKHILPLQLQVFLDEISFFTPFQLDYKSRFPAATALLTSVDDLMRKLDVYG